MIGCFKIDKLTIGEMWIEMEMPVEAGDRNRPGIKTGLRVVLHVAGPIGVLVPIQ